MIHWTKLIAVQASTMLPVDNDAEWFRASIKTSQVCAASSCPHNCRAKVLVTCQNGSQESDEAMRLTPEERQTDSKTNTRLRINGPRPDWRPHLRCLLW